MQKGVETVEWIGSKFVKEFCISIHDNLSEVWFVGGVVVEFYCFVKKGFQLGSGAS